jgi:hypothetical protein
MHVPPVPSGLHPLEDVAQDCEEAGVDHRNRRDAASPLAQLLQHHRLRQRLQERVPPRT